MQGQHGARGDDPALRGGAVGVRTRCRRRRQYNTPIGGS